MSDQETVPVNPFRVPFGNWPFSLMNVQVNISQLILRWFKNVEPVNTAPQRCNCVCKMEWKEKHVVFMVGLHGGRTGVLPRMLREHYQRNLLVGPRVPATDRIHRALEDPGNPRETIWLLPLHTSPINACGLG